MLLVETSDAEVKRNKKVIDAHRILIQNVLITEILLGIILKQQEISRRHEPHESQQKAAIEVRLYATFFL